MYWTLAPNKGYRAGGFWRCAVNKRDYQRARYDADPVHRIGKNLHDRQRRRRETLDRRKAALAEERS